MMQNIRNGQPVVFTHVCPSEREGKVMSHDEYEAFLDDMVYQCFSYAEIILERFPQEEKPKRFLDKLFFKKKITPIFRHSNFMSHQEICDYIVAKSNSELEKLLSMESTEFEEKYTIKDRRFLKALTVKVNNVDHPSELINGDRYTIEIFSWNMYPKQDNYPLPSPLSQNDLVRKVGEAWMNLDADILRSYLDKDFHYKSDFTFSEMSSRDEYLYYLSGKFTTIRKTDDNERKVCNSIVEDIDKNNYDGLFLKLGYMDSVAYIEVVSKGGRIVEMKMHDSMVDPFSDSTRDTENLKDNYNEGASEKQKSKFLFENFDKDLPAIINIAESCIEQVMESKGKELYHDWSWGQRGPSQFSPMNLCLYYEKYVLCIFVTLYREKDGEGQFCMNQDNMDNLIHLCTKYNMTPCLFVIDSISGKPLMPEPFLTDARTHELIDFSKLKEDNCDIMSDWELLINGTNRALNVLVKQGAELLSYCNIPGLFPNIFFNSNGENCFAVVRSIPGGKNKERYKISANSLKKLNSLKGYFVNVRWSHMAWIISNPQDIQLKRSDYPFYIDCSIDIKPLEEAVKMYDFVEIVENEPDV